MVGVGDPVETRRHEGVGYVPRRVGAGIMGEWAREIQSLIERNFSNSHINKEKKSDDAAGRNQNAISRRTE